MNFSPTGDFAVLLRSTEAAARLHWLHHQARERIFAKKNSKRWGIFARTLQNLSGLGKRKIVDSKVPAGIRTCEFPVFLGGYVFVVFIYTWDAIYIQYGLFAEETCF